MLFLFRVMEGQRCEPRDDGVQARVMSRTLGVDLGLDTSGAWWLGLRVEGRGYC